MALVLAVLFLCCSSLMLSYQASHLQGLGFSVCTPDPAEGCWQEELGGQEEPAGFCKRRQNHWGCGFRNEPRIQVAKRDTYTCWGQTHVVLRQVSATCVKKEAVCVCVCSEMLICRSELSKLTCALIAECRLCMQNNRA